jgi:hypothetical protein
VLDPLVNRSGLSIRNSVLFYEQFIRPNGIRVPELVVRFCSHARVFLLRLTQLVSCKKQIHDDWKVPNFAENIRELRAGLHSKLGDTVNFLLQKL